MSHKIDDPRHPWSRLTAAVRQVRDDRDSSVPYGFATRVAALAFAQERMMGSLFERFAFRAVSVASLLALFSIAMNYQAISTSDAAVAQSEEVELVPTDDAVAIVLEIAD